MKGVCSEEDVRCLGHTELDNHAHFVLQSGIGRISTVFQRVLTGYALKFNRRHSRNGRLFENRFAHVRVATETHFLELVRYLALNRYRAGLEHTFDAIVSSPWSSLGEFLGFRSQALTETEPVLVHFANERAAARIRLATFVRDGMERGDSWEPPAMDTYSWDQLSYDEFGESAAARAEADARAAKRLAASGWTTNGVVRFVSEEFGVSPEEIRSRHRTSLLADARAAIAFLSIAQLRVRPTEVARALGLSRAAITLGFRRGKRVVQARALLLDAGGPESETASGVR